MKYPVFSYIRCVVRRICFVRDAEVSFAQRAISKHGGINPALLGPITLFRRDDFVFVGEGGFEGVPGEGGAFDADGEGADAGQGG